MGLDMYLTREPKVKQLVDIGTDMVVGVDLDDYYEEVGYWRKANAIHSWFVDNVQNGIDNCDEYEVTKEQLEALLGRCKFIKEATIMEDGMIHNGSRFSNGQWEEIYEPGKVIVNPEIAEKGLPTRGGFFFGATEYDEYYMRQIDSTIDIITRVLQETNFDTHTIKYSASW